MASTSPTPSTSPASTTSPTPAASAPTACSSPAAGRSRCSTPPAGTYRGPIELHTAHVPNASTGISLYRTGQHALGRERLMKKLETFEGIHRAVTAPSDAARILTGDFNTPPTASTPAAAFATGSTPALPRCAPSSSAAGRPPSAASSPKVAECLETALEDGLACLTFPESNRRRIRSTNGLERFIQELKRRTRVVRIFPNPKACLRLVTALCVEQSEKWLAGRVYHDMRRLEAIDPDDAAAASESEEVTRMAA